MIDDFDGESDVCSILVPVDVTNTAGVLTSMTSNGATLVEDPNPVWSSATTYNVLGQRVYSPVTHKVYENLKTDNTNVNKDPTLAVNRTTAAGVGTYWFEVGSTNKYAMFDDKIATQTSAPGPLVIKLRPGAFNGFAFFGLDADSFSVEVRDAPGGNIIYSEPTIPLEGSMPADYYEWAFDRFRPLRQFVREGIDPYGSSEITVTFNKATGDVKVGKFAIGDFKPIGVLQRDASVEPTDLSYFKQDAFGNADVKKRPNFTSMSGSTVMDIYEAGTVLDIIKDLLGTPVVIIGSNARMYEWLTVFGLISARMTPVPFPFATLNISVKGFI